MVENTCADRNLVIMMLIAQVFILIKYNFITKLAIGQCYTRQTNRQVLIVVAAVLELFITAMIDNLVDKKLLRGQYYYSLLIYLINVQGDGVATQLSKFLEQLAIQDQITIIIDFIATNLT